MSDIPKIEYTDLSIEKEIGKGGFGVIYKGTINGVTVAIKKLLLPEDSTIEVQTTKFQDLYKEASYMR